MASDVSAFAGHPSQPVAGPALVGPIRMTLLELCRCQYPGTSSSTCAHLDDAELVSRERWHGASYDEASR